MTEKNIAEHSYLYADKSEFLNWLRQKSTQCQIYAPDFSGYLRAFSEKDISGINFAPCRFIDPLKPLFFPARGNLGSPFISETESSQELSPRILIGARSCDLSALEILDYVFLGGDYKDESYQLRREKTYLISLDCTEPYESCFCLGLGGEVYPEKGFDLNLSLLNDGILIEIGSEKGKELVKDSGFRSASSEQVKEREEKRKAVHQKLEQSLKEKGYDFRNKDLKILIETSAENPLWLKLAEDCVECAGCNFICPTCHCFILSDWEAREGFVRFQSWDSCQYKNFARVAGGANPRRFRYQRLRNRYEKKFSFFIYELSRYACVGCGRCVEACGGGIDIREVLRELSGG